MQTKPVRLLALLFGFQRLLLKLSAGLLIVLAFYVSLARTLVPMVAEYRLELETQLQTLLEMPVHIGRLEGEWQDWAPVLTAHDVQIGEGGEAITLDAVQLIPDMLSSLLARTLHIRNLTLKGPYLYLREDDQGNWLAEGLPKPQREAETSAALDVGQLLTTLSSLQNVTVLDGRLIVQRFGREPLNFSYVDLSLQYAQQRQRLDARLLLPDGQPVAVRLNTYLQDSRRWRETPFDLYMSLPQTDWSALSPSQQIADWSVLRLQAGGEFWLKGRGAAIERSVLRLHAPRVDAVFASQETVTLEDAAFTLYFDRLVDRQRLFVDSLAVTRDEQRVSGVQLVGWYAQADGQDNTWNIRANRLDLAFWGPLLQALAPMSDTSREWLTGLDIQGVVSNLQASFNPDLEGAERLQFAANLERVGFEAYEDVPSVKNIRGAVNGNLMQGEVLLDAQDFVLHLNRFFPQPWHYRRAQSRFIWQIDEQSVTLRSPYIAVRGEEGTIGADLLIRLFLGERKTENYMDLRVGLRDSDARYTGKYLPTLSPALPPELSDWLLTAIQGGRVEEGYFQYQGSLSEDAVREARSITLFFKVDEATLTFQPGWPSLHDVRADVLVQNDRVQVDVPEARMLDSRISSAQAIVPLQADNSAPNLTVTGDIVSDLGSVLRILNEAPLEGRDIIAGWQGDGALDGHLQLDIPLHKDAQVHVKADFSTQSARLKLADPALDIQQIQGRFRFDSQRGLSSDKVQARVFERNVQGRILAEGSRQHWRSVFDLQGSVEIERLRGWLAIEQPLPLRGTLPYRLRLTLDGEDSQLRIDSSLMGVAIDLPEPFGKKSGESRYADFRMTLAGAERRYWFDYKDVASLALAAGADDFSEARGELRLGGELARLPGRPGLIVRGRLPVLDWVAWQQVLAKNAWDTGADKQSLLRDVRLQIGQLVGFGSLFDPLDIHLWRNATDWSADVQSPGISGRIVLADSAQQPIEIDLQYLQLPAPEQGQSVGDPLAQIDPQQIPSLNVQIREVRLGDKRLGSWSFTARPEANGVRFSNLQLQLLGLQLEGSMGWQGEPGTASSWYKGRIRGDDLEKVLLAWDFAPTIRSEQFRFDVDGHWPGSPAGFALQSYTGTLDTSVRKGQLIEVQSSAQALRVFGLLNFNAIGRRLRLDFSDLFSKGLGYDRIKGVLYADKGVYRTREPLTLTGPSSNLELNGTLDMPNEWVDAKLLVTLPVTNNLPLAALLVGAPAVGGALFVVDKLLGDSVARFASVQYDIKGSIMEPAVTFDKPFEAPK